MKLPYIKVEYREEETEAPGKMSPALIVGFGLHWAWVYLLMFNGQIILFPQAASMQALLAVTSGAAMALTLLLYALCLKQARVLFATPFAIRRNRFGAAVLMVATVVLCLVGNGLPAAAAPCFAVAGVASGVGTAVLFGTLTAAGAALLAGGIDRLRTASQLKSFRRIFGDREACTFDDIAARALISRPKALARARKLIRRGLIPQGRIDHEATTLMVTENAYRQYCTLQQHQRQIAESQRAAEEARVAEAAARQSRERDLSDRLTPEQRAFVATGRDYLGQLRRLDESIDDAAVSERIVAIEEVVGRILARAEGEPSVIAGLDRLTAYYLPTTVKLLAAYDNLEEQPVQGENIAASRREIEHTLGVLHSAFEKLLDDTYQDLSLDVSADIAVLQAMLAQEGLVDGPFDVKP